MAIYANYDDERKKLADEIAEIEKSNVAVEKPTLPKVTLEQKNYDPPTDDELSARAEANLSDYKRQNENAIADKSAAEEKELTAKRKAAETELDNRLGSLDELYRNAIDNIDNDVLKRGLARSTVATNYRAQAESDYLNKAASIKSELGGKISELDGQIASVGDRLNAALNDFNLSYAAKLTQTLQDLKAERQKKLDEIVEYNNNIKSKQAALDTDRIKTESDLFTAAIKQQDALNDLNILPDSVRDEVYQSVYNKLDAFLGSLGTAEARNEIRTQSVYRDHLSDKYFYKLYDKYGR